MLKLTPNWAHIQHQIKVDTGYLINVEQRRSVSGGCINQAFIVGGAGVDNTGSHYFIKLNHPELASMFEAEFEGLQEILASKSIAVPQPIAHGVAGDVSYLLMTCIEFAPAQRHSDHQFATSLAEMHRHSREKFGWHRDNTIGSTPQINTPETTWVAFWRKQRLLYQLNLCEQNGAPSQLIDSGQYLAERLEDFFLGYTPLASCLHGDLWSGNWGFDTSGNAVVFDPAVYFGDRETDIAMMELFGGMSAAFYSVYNETYPLESDYPVRRTLYNLYHILNHFNLFGGSYASQAENMIQQLLSQIK